jgi:hypothetical protein
MPPRDVAPVPPAVPAAAPAPVVQASPPTAQASVPPVADPATNLETAAAPVAGQGDQFGGAPGHRENGYGNGHPALDPGDRQGGDGTPPNGSTCTAPQLRRFIKSRAYVPMHELRRRFGINGGEDDVTRVELDGEQIYVGLPGHEGRLLGELLRGGEVGYELSLDPRSPVVIGVYPMRPVPRP